MTSRRSFIISSGLTAAMSRSAMGANDRIRMGLIGSGSRGRVVSAALASYPDCQFIAVCDVYRPNLEKGASALPNKPEQYVDYRKVIDRKDVDAVLIATPDHWHAQMVIEACQAGKDAYCEKPASNDIAAAAKAVDVVKKTNRIVEIGLQQRSWEHFKMVRQRMVEKKFGTVYHAALHWQGNYTRPAEAPTDPPEELNWELFQGPAPRKPYIQSRQRSWRSWYDYGGGIITDQGVHIADIVHWYLDAGEPRSVTASAQWVRAQPTTEMPPDTWALTWQYNKFVMTFANVYMPMSEFENSQGNYFYGTAGSLHVSRSGYTAKPIPQPAGRGGAGGRGAAGAPPAPPPPAFDPINVGFQQNTGPADLAHARNFLDCVKSRKKPLTDYETGFYSSLPLLLGVLAVRTGKNYNWDGERRQAVAMS